MSGKNLMLKDCDIARAEMLYAEIGKVRCWLTGWKAGRTTPGTMSLDSPPGEESLRQMQIILRDSIGAQRNKS